MAMDLNNVMEGVTGQYVYYGLLQLKYIKSYAHGIFNQSADFMIRKVVVSHRGEEGFLLHI